MLLANCVLTIQSAIFPFSARLQETQMKNSRVRLLALTMPMLLAACNTSTQPNGPAQHTAAIENGFKLTIGQYSLKASTGIEQAKINGKRADIVANQVILRLKDDSAIDRVAKRYKLNVIKQEVFPGPTEVVRNTDGTVKEIPSTTLHREPVFTASFSNLDDVSTGDLESVAQSEGFKGHYHFNTQSGARLLRAAIAIKNAKDADIVDVSVDPLNYPDSMTYEGHAPGQNGYRNAPDNGDFWFTGRYEFGWFWGANIIDDRAGYNNLSYYGTGANIKVAVIDAGFQGSNETGGISVPVIGPGTYYHYNQDSDSASIIGAQGKFNQEWHGRKVMSTIKAPNNDYGGALGTAPGCTVLLEHVGPGYYSSDCTAAIDQARVWGARVINMSYSGPWSLYNPQLNAIQTANMAGVVCISGTGNNGYNVDSYPVAWAEVMGVGATDKYGARAIWSSPTDSSNSLYADIWAPGTGIAVATIPTNSAWDYETANGTSFAAPMVAGVVAACMANGRITNSTTLPNRESATTRLYDTGYVYPVGRALNAIRAAQ